MSLNAILQAIELWGEAKVREIEEDARERADKLLANARLRAQQIEEDEYARELAPAYRERARLIHRAHLERLQIIGSAREALVDRALDQARGHLSQIRANPIYPTVLRRIIRETLAELEGTLEDVSRSLLLVDPRDQGLLEEIMVEMNLTMAVGYALNCWGGIMVESGDGRVVIINTLESRFSRIASFLRRYLAVLFEDQEREGHFSRSEARPVG